MHIAVVAASDPSHMHPHLAAVRELVERGHRVSYVVSGHLAELAASTGADIVSCTSVLPGAPGAPPNWPADDVAGMRLFLDEAIHVLPQLHAALDRDRPDVVVYDIGGMAQAAADLVVRRIENPDAPLAESRFESVFVPRSTVAAPTG